MDDFTPSELGRLADYFAGELSVDERADLERWIQANPQRNLLIQSLRRSRPLQGADAFSGDSELAGRVDSLARNFSRARVEDRAMAGFTATPTSRLDADADKRRVKVSEGPFYSKRSWYAAAATMFGVLGVAAGLYFSSPQGGTSSSEFEFSSYTTADGERATVTLPDGSTVFLNVGSRLEVPANYSNGNRDIKLSGEAFFTVVSHASAPFTVRSGPSVTKVLGTQFSVRYYEGDTAANVLVRDGKVSVGSAVLSANQEIYVSSLGPSQVRQIASHQSDFTTGVLVLNDISIANAIPDLNRWYNVDIQLGDTSLAKRKVMGDFKAGSVSDVMSILELMFNLKIERDGKVLTLYSRE